MWTIAIWFFIIMYAVNGFALFLDSAIPGYDLVNPFTNQTIAFPSQPSPVTTLTNINETTSTNATGGDDVNLWDTAAYAWNATIFIVNLLTGGFIFSAIAAFLPAAGATLIVYGIIQGSVAFFLALTILHFWRGIL